MILQNISDMENIPETYKVIIVLVATGILMFPVVFFYNKYIKWRRTKMNHKLALIINNMYQYLLKEDVTLLPINATKYKELDMLFYESIWNYLQKNNFSLIGDYEDANFRKNYPSIIYFERIMVSSDGTVICTISNLKKGKSFTKTISLLSEFNEGTFLTTANNFHDTYFDQPKEFKLSFIKTESIQELLEQHTINQQKINESSNSAIKNIYDVSDIINQMKRAKTYQLIIVN